MTLLNLNGARRRSVLTSHWNIAKKRDHFVWALEIAQKSWNFGWNMNWEILTATQQNDTSYFESFQTFIICNILVCNYSDDAFMALRKLCRCPSFGRRKVNNKLCRKIGVKMVLSLHETICEEFFVLLITIFQKYQLKPCTPKSLISTFQSPIKLFASARSSKCRHRKLGEKCNLIERLRFTWCFPEDTTKRWHANSRFTRFPSSSHPFASIASSTKMEKKKTVWFRFPCQRGTNLHRAR